MVVNVVKDGVVKSIHNVTVEDEQLSSALYELVPGNAVVFVYSEIHAELGSSAAETLAADEDLSPEEMLAKQVLTIVVDEPSEIRIMVQLIEQFTGRVSIDYLVVVKA